MTARNILIVMLAACISFPSTLPAATGKAIDQNERMRWWREARFGLFIHWGVYSVLGGQWQGRDYGKEMGGASAEWIMLRAPVPTDEYTKLAKRFNPVKFNAQAWVGLAKKAGMKYLVITAKHHDGFCLFDTACTNYDIMDAGPFKRDVIGELSRECKRQGIRFGVYYSQRQDWYHRGRDSNKKPTAEYVAMAKGQVRELLTNYGDIGVVWFDTGGSDLELNNSYGQLVRTLQPRTIICSRLYSRRAKRANRKYADFDSLPDRTVTTRRIQTDAETCMTMRHNWGYDRDDDNWKSKKDLIERLALSACRGANFLLNVGPRPDGTLCPEEIERLEAISKWMKINGESIHGTTASPLDFDFEWGAITHRPGKLYLHVMKWNSNRIALHGLASKPTRAYLLADPQRNALTVTQETNKHTTTITTAGKAPDEYDSVIVLEFDDAVRIDPSAKGKYQWAKTTGLKHHRKTR